MTDKKTHQPQLLILEATAGGGHLSISQAICQQLPPHIQVIRENVSHRLMDKFYQFTSRQFLSLYVLLYKATDSKRRAEIATKLNLAVQKRKIKHLIQKHKPDLILSNTQMAVKEVPHILHELQLDTPFFVFVPDPFTVHSLCFSEHAALTMVATLSAYQSALHYGLSTDKIRITGHPVRQDFFTSPSSLSDHRLSLGLQPDQYTILFGGSGDGAEKTLEILIYLGAKPSQQLLSHLLKYTGSALAHELRNLAQAILTGELVPPQPQDVRPQMPFQAVFVTGSNTRLKHELEQIQFPDYITPHILGHVTNMDQYLHASDLVVGKAGPNIILESVAAGKPFLATYHIKGQEDGNLEMIRYNQIGFVEEHPKSAAQLIRTILDNPRLLDHTKPGLEFLRSQHLPAAQNIATQITNYTTLRKQFR